MSVVEIQRQYDDIIAEHYDHDPQLIISQALLQAVSHLKQTGEFDSPDSSADVLDVGVGTGLFFEKLKQALTVGVQPFGLDVSEKMVDVAKSRLPDLECVIDDAANLSRHFAGRQFDVICTHFVTGFVPMEDLAPVIWEKLKPGGYWSFVGGTSNAFPALQKKAESPSLRVLFGGKRLDASALLTPSDCDAVLNRFRQHGFEVCNSNMFEPELNFGDFEQFMDFAYRGGWLTPFIEELGLQNAGGFLRATLNRLVFPVRDCHRIAIGLARRPLKPQPGSAEA